MGSPMELSNPTKSPPLLGCPFSQPSLGFLLTRRILAWSQESGMPPSVRVRFGIKTFHLHKSLLVLKCGYFKMVLAESPEANLPVDFPGGPETFEKVALFIYGYTMPFDPFTVVATRCAAEFLEMTEDHAAGNLCERCDLYLNHVVLQTWDDTMVVLQRCQPFLPWSEQLVRRCVESLSFMACMEILDPEKLWGKSTATLKALAGRPWSCYAAKEVAGQDYWIRDLITLPFPFFSMIVGSLRRQGMKEKYVSVLIVFYASKWLFSDKTQQLPTNSGDQNTRGDAVNDASSILEGVIGLIPSGKKACRVIPVGFYLSLLSKALGSGIDGQSMRKLQKQITSLLHTAHVTELLQPENSEGQPMASTAEVKSMENVFSMYASVNSGSGYLEETPSSRSTVVAELWDCYLAQIAADRELRPSRFMELIEVVPDADRDTHDHLYRAMNFFLLNHPQLSSDEKASICNYLDCRKLSEGTCIRAVQNDLMPLRLIFQALFVQQQNTQQVFRDCSGSFRSTHARDYSGILSSAKFQLCKIPNVLGESPLKQCSEDPEEDTASGVASLGFLLRRDVAAERTASNFEKMEHESESFRIQTLGQELRTLRGALQLQKREPTKKSGTGKRRTKKEQGARVASYCLASMSWALQARCTRRLLKALKRIAMWGGGRRSKRHPRAPAATSAGFVFAEARNA